MTEEQTQNPHSGISKERTQHPIYGAVDIQCITILDAINSIPGLKTTNSCCGHGKNSFYTFISAEEPICFHPLLTVLRKAKEVWNCGIWHIELIGQRNDEPRNPANLLYSETMGEQAYKEANTIAMIINKSGFPIGTDKEFDKAWNMCQPLPIT
jgi:hypothetical protein